MSDCCPSCCARSRSNRCQALYSMRSSTASAFLMFPSLACKASQVLQQSNEQLKAVQVSVLNC